jgi:hypothetical protein
MASNRHDLRTLLQKVIGAARRKSDVAVVKTNKG